MITTEYNLVAPTPSFTHFQTPVQLFLPGNVQFVTGIENGQWNLRCQTQANTAESASNSHFSNTGVRHSFHPHTTPNPVTAIMLKKQGKQRWYKKNGKDKTKRQERFSISFPLHSFLVIYFIFLSISSLHQVSSLFLSLQPSPAFYLCLLSPCLFLSAQKVCL